MNAKVAFTLILGLVFQLAQVLPGAVIQSPCQTQENSCACCEGAKSCHCVENGNTDQKPTPVPLQSRGDFKVPAVKSTEANVSLADSRAIHPPARVVAPPHAGSVSGFTGVRLSVAFCSFVI